MSLKRLAKLEQIHHNAIQMKIKGYSVKAIAEQMRKSVATVYSWWQDDLFKAEYQRVLEDLKESGEVRLKGLIRNSVDLLEEALIDKTITNQQVIAAREILDRAGITKVNKQEVKMDGQINTTHDFNDKLLEDPEAVAALKKLFEKMSEDNE